jgi:hypothetical protein
MALSQLNGNLFLRGIYASQDGYSDKTLTDILRLGKRYGATTCLIESNFGDGLVMEVMKKHAIEMRIGMAFEEVRSTTRKEDRIIDTLEPILNQHRLVIDTRLVTWDYQSNQQMAPEDRLPRMLMYQLTRMCREKGAVKHDDRLDCLSLGVKFFQDVMAVSQLEQDKAQRRAQWDAMLDAFITNPVMATDMLVHGGDFSLVKQGSDRIESWVGPIN